MAENVAQTFKMDYDYDTQNDSLFLYVKDNYSYKKSLRLDEDLILDFNEDKVPIGLEILNASRRFRIDKVHLRQPLDLNMSIEIAEDHICIKVIFKIRNKPTPLEFNAEAKNRINLPSTETSFASVI